MMVMMWLFIAKADMEAWPTISLPDLFFGQTSNLPALKRSRSRMEKSLSHNLANPSSATTGVVTPVVGDDVEAPAMGSRSTAVIKSLLASPWSHVKNVGISLIMLLHQHWCGDVFAPKCLTQSFLYSNPWREKIAHETEDVPTPQCGSLPTWGSIMRWYCWNMSAVLELAPAAEDSANGTWQRNQLWNMVLNAGSLWANISIFVSMTTHILNTNCPSIGPRESVFGFVLPRGCQCASTDWRSSSAAQRQIERTWAHAAAKDDN